MSNEVINHVPSVERAKELEIQAREGLDQMKQGQVTAILACHKMRDTKAYSALGFNSYYAWGESALNLKKSRLNELALAGEVQQELLMAVNDNVKQAEVIDNKKAEAEIKTVDALVDFKKEDSSDEAITDAYDDQVLISADTMVSAADLSEIGTPQLLALAKAPKGERLAVLDKVVEDSKAEDKPITTTTIKEAVKASAESSENMAESDDEKALVIKKQHKSVMGKVAKLTDSLNQLDMTQVDSEELESWKVYLDEVKVSIATLEQQLGY